MPLGVFSLRPLNKKCPVSIILVGPPSLYARARAREREREREREGEMHDCTDGWLNVRLYWDHGWKER